jgi:Domain of unknown function (DUF1963)/Leucine rich repeat
MFHDLDEYRTEVLTNAAHSDRALARNARRQAIWAVQVQNRVVRQYRGKRCSLGTDHNQQIHLVDNLLHTRRSKRTNPTKTQIAPYLQDVTMSNTEYFRLNGVDVGFSERTDVRVRRGRVRVSLNTPAMRLTKALHGGLLEHAWRPIPDFYMVNGLTVVAYEDLALPNGAYGQTIRFPYYDDAKYLQNVHVYGAGGSPNFFGSITVDEGWITVIGLASYEDEAPDPKFAMSIEARKRFAAKPLIPIRKKLSLRQALKLPPDQVYWLSIENNDHVKSFPTEILSFKSLEELWLSASFGAAPVPLPNELFSLVNLHTLSLQWAGFTVGALSPAIEKLSKLETLRLTSNRITSLPDSLSALRSLEFLDVSYNELTRLPHCIGELPELRTLEAEGNRFESLPKTLANVRSVRVNHAYRSLFRDVTYITKNDAPVDETQFMLRERQALFIQTKHLLDQQSKDDELKALMLEQSTYAIYAESTVASSPVSLGASKTGGAPHLPKGFAHPSDANGLFPTFFAQINLSSIAHLQAWLPRTGMLYFFVNDFRYGDGPCVIHANVDPSDLVFYEYSHATRWFDSDVDALHETDSSGLARESTLSFSAGVSLPYVYRATGTRFPALAALFDSNAPTDRIRRVRFDSELETTREALKKANLMPKNTTHSLNALIWSDDDTAQEQAANAKGGFANEWINLLTLESVDDYCFGDAGSIAFCVHKKDLAAADFSNVVCVVGH